jgi:GntR family transcriptional regulator
VSQPTPIRDRRPLPLRVFEALRLRIAAGEFPPGSRLPAEMELARAYAVSRVTVREALRMLQGEGLVEARHGLGHFVAERALIREPITELRSVSDLLDSLGEPASTEVLAVEREEARELAGPLEIDPHEFVLRIERLRRSGGDLVIYSVDVLPVRILAGTEPDFSGSLVVALEQLGVTLSHAQATIRASALPRRIARRVGLAPSAPWLLLEQVHFDSAGRPVLWSLDYHRGDRFEFNVRRRRFGV